VPTCTLALPWPLWYLGACRMLSYPPHSAQQQQATSPMSLTFTGQTQRHQQQQQSKDEPTTDKTPATADDEELQKPLKVLHYVLYSA